MSAAACVRVVLPGCVIAVTAMAPGAAAAQMEAWPRKTLRVICPFAPGGATDIFARVFSQRLQAALKQNVVVDNWQGLFAPPALPRKIQLALDREAAEIVRSKEFSDLAYKQGAEADHIGLDQFAAFVRKDHARWKQIIDRNQIRGEQGGNHVGAKSTARSAANNDSSRWMKPVTTKDQPASMMMSCAALHPT